MCQEESFRALTTPVMTLDLNHFDGAASNAMVEWRHPFLDRRLIEFFLGVPSPVKLRAGQRKGFAQLALSGIAPGPVRDQEDETAVIPPQDGRISRALEVRQLERLFGPANGPLFRYVRSSEMPRLMRSYVNGDLSIRTHLWKMRDLQRWMQRHFPGEMPLVPVRLPPICGHWKHWGQQLLNISALRSMVRILPVRHLPWKNKA